jgi:transcriptional regulator with PAS, ATPase and Fis domain
MEYLVNVVPNGEVIDERLLPPSIAKGLKTDRSVPPKATQAAAPADLENMERQMIELSLQRHKNKKRAADELGIGIATLYRKVKKYGIQIV